MSWSHSRGTFNEDDPPTVPKEVHIHRSPYSMPAVPLMKVAPCVTSKEPRLSHPTVHSSGDDALPWQQSSPCEGGEELVRHLDGKCSSAKARRCSRREQNGGCFETDIDYNHNQGGYHRYGAVTQSTHGEIGGRSHHGYSSSDAGGDINDDFHHDKTGCHGSQEDGGQHCMYKKMSSASRKFGPTPTRAIHWVRFS